MSEEIFYFGCVNEPGHFLFSSRRNYCVPLSERPKDLPVKYGMLDGGFCPPLLADVEGVASLWHGNNWTIFAFWDRSVDNRGNSSSTFAMRGIHDFPEAVRIAQEAFPKIWARYPFEVVQFLNVR